MQVRFSKTPWFCHHYHYFQKLSLFLLNWYGLFLRIPPLMVLSIKRFMILFLLPSSDSFVIFLPPSVLSTYKNICIPWKCHSLFSKGVYKIISLLRMLSVKLNYTFFLFFFGIFIKIYWSQKEYAPGSKISTDWEKCFSVLLLWLLTQLSHTIFQNPSNVAELPHEHYRSITYICPPLPK